MGHISLSPAAGAAAPCIHTSIIQSIRPVSFQHWQHVCDRSPSSWSEDSLTAHIYSFPLPSSPFPGENFLFGLVLHPSVFLWFSPSLSLTHLLSFISLLAQFFLVGDRCWPSLKGFRTLPSPLCFVSFPHVPSISLSPSGVRGNQIFFFFYQSQNTKNTSLWKPSKVTVHAFNSLSWNQKPKCKYMNCSSHVNAGSQAHTTTSESICGWSRESYKLSW